jgi:hypothetical protein
MSSTTELLAQRAIRAARRAALALIAAGSLGCSLAAWASDQAAVPATVELPKGAASDKAKPAETPSHAYDPKLAGAPGQSSKATGSVLRCWQGGQMIFEGRGYAALPPSQVTADLRPADSSAGRVQIMDFYEGLCVLELIK